MAKATQSDHKTIALNRRARAKYEIQETFNAGLSLRGTEVKTLREGRVSIEEAYGRLVDDELWLIGAHIEEYSHGNRENHEPTRRRKLLLKRREIERIRSALTQKRWTLVPLELWFNERGIAKLTIAVATGKKLHDKRESLKAKEARKDIRRVV